MKKLATILLIVALAVGGAALYLVLGASLKPISVALNETPAAKNLSEWTNLYLELSDETFQGASYISEPMGDSALYVFRTYSIELRNLGLIKAEAITISIIPLEGDVVQYGDSRLFALPAFSNGTITVTMLSLADSPPARVASVDYYVFGRKMNVLVNVE